MEMLGCSLGDRESQPACPRVGLRVAGPGHGLFPQGRDLLGSGRPGGPSSVGRSSGGKGGGWVPLPGTSLIPILLSSDKPIGDHSDISKVKAFSQPAGGSDSL